MARYDYRSAMYDDILEYIQDNHITVNSENRDEIEEKLNEDLWIEDSVTGNGSGSYTFSTYDAEENLCHNLDLLGEALEEFGCSPDYMAKNGPEACDVTIRCYLLGQVIAEVLDDIEEDE